MNRIDDITIERYLAGEMSPAEQAEFRALMASDTALRRRVASEETMVRAMRADREAARRDHADVRSRVLASIPAIAPAGTKPAPAAREAKGFLRWPLFGVVVVVAGWVALDLVALDETGRGADVRRVDTAAAAPRAAAPAAAPVDAPAPAIGTSAAAVEGDRSSTAAADDAAAAQQRPAVKATARPVTAPSRDARVRATSTTEPAAVTSQPSDAASETPAQPKQLPKRTDNVARTNVKIDGDK
jgi:hypothetical protein